jgi:two-component system, OmpR family, response regulator
LTATDTQMRLLIIEDDRESADYLVKAFREVGYIADLASDGEEGLALADSGDYDVLVIDRMLPKRDGLSLIGTLREKGNRTPALILSALGQVELDRLSHRVARGKDELTLQPREFRLLEYLMKHAGQVVTRTMLLENVWDYHFDPQTNVIDVHISRLRSKIDKGFERPLLHTIRGAGYMIRDGIR